jgi:hypothetical protein
MNKQETLEEAMNANGYHDQSSDDLWREGVKFGVKWQAERMYSEEDMKQFAEWLIKVNFNYTSNISDVFLIWKKQFKKK